ncbi:MULTISPECIES: hypothetical protein [unclassified Candidatus Cardinium]|uniref:hypothetical protein n=1 Tax=unclassified Candidatus Cardinium TaxID=2641185 RepID=UPI001FB4DBD5|nr:MULTISPECIES: hypothetical protein [unclassified Candidatus Cardinium]
MKYQVLKTARWLGPTFIFGNSRKLAVYRFHRIGCANGSTYGRPFSALVKLRRKSKNAPCKIVPISKQPLQLKLFTEGLILLLLFYQEKSNNKNSFFTNVMNKYLRMALGYCKNTIRLFQLAYQDLAICGYCLSHLIAKFSKAISAFCK